MVLNPVRAKKVKRLGDWAWGSYGATAGEAPCLAYRSASWVLSQFHRETGRAGGSYKRFAEQGLRKKGTPFERLAAQMVLGGPEFVESWRAKTENKRDIQVHPRVQRKAVRPALVSLLNREEAGGRAGLARQVREAHVFYGYTLAEIAKHLGIHYATAGRLLKLSDGPSKLSCQKERCDPMVLKERCDPMVLLLLPSTRRR